jgi:hypothetical protein
VVANWRNGAWFVAIQTIAKLNNKDLGGRRAAQANTWAKKRKMSVKRLKAIFGEMMRANTVSSTNPSNKGRVPGQIQAPRSLSLVEPRKAAQSRRKFLRFFPQAFRDETYLDWERNYKWNAHLQWNELLGLSEYRALLQQGKFSEISAKALKIESRTNLLFSFEKMAIRDAVKSQGERRLSLPVCLIFCTGQARRRRNLNTGAMLWLDFQESKLGFSPGRC